jgi:GAF domain-containing protein
VAGWCAANRRFVLNADPAIDFGSVIGTMNPPLRASLIVPLSHDGALTAVLALYSAAADAFTDDHVRLLTLLAPSLASSIAALPAVSAWSQPEPLRPAAGELRLMRR